MDFRTKTVYKRGAVENIVQNATYKTSQVETVMGLKAFNYHISLAKAQNSVEDDGFRECCQQNSII
eukprot:5959984-Amphidinium_carterae.1